jgi:hypothetical protein
MPSRYGIWTQGQYYQKLHGIKHHLTWKKDSITSIILHTESQSAHTYMHAYIYENIHARFCCSNSIQADTGANSKHANLNTSLPSPGCSLRQDSTCTAARTLTRRLFAPFTAWHVNQPISPFTAGWNRYWNLEIISCSIRGITWAKLLETGFWIACAGSTKSQLRLVSRGKLNYANSEPVKLCAETSESAPPFTIDCPSYYATTNQGQYF